jgi:hypothetical protein
MDFSVPGYLGAATIPREEEFVGSHASSA